MTSYRLVHRAIVGQASQFPALALAARTHRHVAAIRWLWRGFSGELHCHHTAEDSVMFPALAERLGSTALFDRTAVDHARLDELVALIDALVTTSRHAHEIVPVAPLFVELATLVEAHFGFEDADILPEFPRHFDAEEYADLEERVVRQLGVSRQAWFTVPFLLRWATDVELEHALATAPRPFVLIHRLASPGHERRMRRLPSIRP